jgi:three-Cys-motif partner protein
VLVDEDPHCIDALRSRARQVGMEERVGLIPRDVNLSAQEVLDALPDWKRDGGVLSFCFIDPFKVDLDFQVIRSLAHLRVDILLMIPLGYDVRRNWRDYVHKEPMRNRLSAFLGESDWVAAWADLKRPYAEFPRFVQGRMNAAMERLGFIELESRDVRDVKVAGKNVYLYSLHLYSKSEVAIKFWRNALKGTSEQHALDL